MKRAERARRLRIAKALRRVWRQPGRRRRLAQWMKRQWKNPRYRRLRCEQMRGWHATPTTKRRMSRAFKRRWRDPVHRRKMIRALTKAWQDPARRAQRIQISRRNLGPSRGAMALRGLLGSGWLLECWTPAGPIDVGHPAMRLGIEVDDVSHRRPKQQRRDRQKERQLKRLGWTVFRISEASCGALGGAK